MCAHAPCPCPQETSWAVPEDVAAVRSRERAEADTKAEEERRKRDVERAAQARVVKVMGLCCEESVS